MREILFRGRGNRGKWVEGFYTPISTGHDGMKDAIITGTDRNCFIPVIVIPETIGQYTGLTDKNGKNIFEGDIVSTSKEDERGVVRWEDSDAAYVIGCDDNIDLSFLENLWGRDVEVIGNIHDNPELAEGLL